ncbi:tRNA pseudouridine 5S synthase [Candidatus Blochmanniella floridana]|uniref:tRNA pseudouridine synthase B n=1 Tax=Blochmanniella floridana TaxID=203907 RepID=TRUB_BLOFL|nr:RecName: Full=tRNA pseudouridine synthase B; AltName: Full=tRNA pseudouridine(55) synthase; Short=Psi55 synthase; AltName: Full=tRNA pseudouridylate synthase; AltName: Full=tRNA-uridine isomerase [Candidatus Blochmannia floridanus]CAD83627.1 tRNA pseudouridine 5S synthase [Candidatus Blochmannia floridanus]
MQRYVNFFDKNRRDVHGLLLLDKPTGFSSSFFLNKIKKLFYAKKVGYIGTLDPIATGMLPICFGKATKFASYLLNSDKRYRVLVKLGESTDTFDASGVIIRIADVQCNKEKIEECLKSFLGTSLQIPPMFSSLKYQGLPLYKYARRGVNIPRKSRTIHVYSLYCLNQLNSIIELEIHCSKGTYVRSIVNDIGEYLGCGAHIISLRRLMVGQYIASMMVNIKTIESIFFDKDLNDLEVLDKLDNLLISTETIMCSF